MAGFWSAWAGFLRESWEESRKTVVDGRLVWYTGALSAADAIPLLRRLFGHMAMYAARKPSR